jgi:hypothetical protein
VHDTIDPQVHLIEVPGIARLGPAPAQFAGELGTEPLAPLPDALVADRNAPLGQDQFDVRKAAAEQVIEILCGWKEASLVAS